MSLSAQKTNRITILSLGALSIVLSFLFVKYIPALPVISDSADYHTIAAHILSDHTYVTISSDDILYPPLYPLFLSLIYSAGMGSFSIVYIIQYFLVGGIALCVFYILRKFARAPLLIALLAAGTTLLWPYLILYSQLISSEILYSFLLMLSFLLFMHIRRESTPALIITTGVTIGLAILTRPVALLLLPWILIGLFLIQKIPGWFGTFSFPWRHYFQVALIMFIVLLPWEIYVKVKYDRVIPVASNLSYVFKKANSTMAYLSPDGIAPEHQSFLKAKAKNIYLFWDPGASGYHFDIVKEKYPAAEYGVLFYKVMFFIILGMGAFGAVYYRRDRLVLFCVVLITYFWALHTVLFPFPRYALPILPFVIIVAGATLSYGYTRHKETSHRITSSK